ncbi:hypothetical protein [Lutibacter citreus]|uniref:hypothetical protein n=1 Tax=Lutibacter citreus TaxID=2138210 RepID=UPI000DBE2DF9|nr:hypothetical protein [Lutibacter citreus]
MYRSFKAITLLVVISILVLSCTSNSFKIEFEGQNPAVEFGLKELKKALIQKEFEEVENSEKYLISAEFDETLKKQAYKIELDNNKISIFGGDKRGLLYGIMDLTEQISLYGDLSKIESKTEEPFIEYRGVKMNIALDGRLPSYDDTGDAAQKNIAEMWNMDFWVEYLDELARNRYNMLTFWSKHPFPALTKMKDYPGAAMEDVYVYDKPVTWDMHRDWSGTDIQDKNNLRKIKSMTMDEKISFWKKVMEHAHNRGIDVVWFTWNIFISPGTGEMLEPESEEAMTYMRKAVQEMVETYPHLSGFGVTAGERMGMTVGKYTATQWMYETYGKGVLAAKKSNPERPFRFIFRRHHTKLPLIQRDFASNFQGEVETSYKYNVARMYSSPNPPIFEQEYLQDVLKYDFKCWMNIRNDDIFTFRWGDPDYVREYLTGMMKYPVPGFYIGSDGYLWGREFTSKIPSLSGELEIKKHWYREMLWGRLAYNPNLPDTQLINVIGNRFPGTNNEALFNAWKYASKTFPLVCNFHWKPGDAMWSTEGCMDQYTGFQTIRDFIDCFTLENEKLQNITDFVDDIKSNESSKLITPLQVADSLRLCTTNTRKYLSELKGSNKNNSEEFKATVKDLECFALYGDYYAGKIAGATYLHMYESLFDENKESYKEKAIKETSLAAVAWKDLAKIADSQYKTQLLARTRELDWVNTIDDVENDIDIVRKSKGIEPKVAKIFYSGYAKVEKSQKQKLDSFLKSKGYKVEEYQGWKVEAYATGLKIVISRNDDLVSQFYTSRGGMYPSNFDEKGFHIEELNHKLWLIGNSILTANEGVDYLIEKLKKELK